MITTLKIALGSLIAALMIAAPIAYKRWRDRDTRNFHVVQEGVLYRSGQLPLPRLQHMVFTRGIRTIVCLRHGNDAKDQSEENWAKSNSIKFVRIPPPSWNPDADGKIPADKALQTFRDVMDDPANYPVLVHCFAGIHRTGAMCAVFRMDYQGWSNEQAMKEMRALGYSILDDHEDVHSYMTKYRSPQSTKAVRATPVARPGHP